MVITVNKIKMNVQEKLSDISKSINSGNIDEIDKAIKKCFEHESDENIVTFVFIIYKIKYLQMCN